MIGLAFRDRALTEAEVGAIVAEAFAKYPVDGQRVLVIIPDTTRTAPIPLFFRLISDFRLRRKTRTDLSSGEIIHE